MSSELEQLRKEVNELRERVAKLEAKPNYYIPPITYPAPGTSQPFWIWPTPIVTCKTETSTVPRSESGLL